MDIVRKVFKDKSSDEDDSEKIEKMSKGQIQARLKHVGLPHSGKLPILRQRLQKYYASQVAVGDAAQETGTSVHPSVGTSVDPSVGTSAASAKTKAKKKWRLTDPAEIAPHYSHHDLFRSNFPLVEVVKVPGAARFPVVDKFEGLKINPDVTRDARKMWSRRLVQVSRMFETPLNEKQAFPFHMALIEGMKSFTLPSPEERERLQECRKRKRNEIEAVVELWDYVGQTAAGEDELYGLSIAAVEDVQDVFGRDTSTGSCNEGLTVVSEGSVELEGDLQEHDILPTGFADSVLYLHDYQPLKRQRRSDEDQEEIVVDTKKVAAILERKFEEDKSKQHAVFQGGFYAAKHAMHNLQKGHGTPLYVLVMTSHTWSYAELVPEGYIQIQDGKIDPRSLEVFRSQQDITGRSNSDLRILEEKLAHGTEFYRKNFQNNPKAQYRNGPMLVGRLYVRDTWFPLPTTLTAGFTHPGAQRLFDGLLRLIVGDSILKMSKKDLEQRMYMNELIDDILNIEVH